MRGWISMLSSSKKHKTHFELDRSLHFFVEFNIKESVFVELPFLGMETCQRQNLIVGGSKNWGIRSGHGYIADGWIRKAIMF